MYEIQYIELNPSAGPVGRSRAPCPFPAANVEHHALTMPGPLLDLGQKAIYFKLNLQECNHMQWPLRARMICPFKLHP